MRAQYIHIYIEAKRNEMERWVNAADKMLPQAFIYSTKPVRFSICVESNSISRKQRENLEQITSRFMCITKYGYILKYPRGKRMLSSRQAAAAAYRRYILESPATVF